MTKEEIIKLARETGFIGSERLQQFAALVAAAEREACAQECDVINSKHIAEYGHYVGHTYAADCAAAIRARGEPCAPPADTEVQRLREQRDELLEALRNMVEMFKDVPTLEQNSFDEPPEPKTQWDYEAYQMIGAASAAIKAAEGA